MADSLAADKGRAGNRYGPGFDRFAGLREVPERRPAGGRDSADDAEPGKPRHESAKRVASIALVVLIFAAWVAALLIGGGYW